MCCTGESGQRHREVKSQANVASAVILKAVKLLIGFRTALAEKDFEVLHSAGVSIGLKPYERKVRRAISMIRSRGSMVSGRKSRKPFNVRGWIFCCDTGHFQNKGKAINHRVVAEDTEMKAEVFVQEGAEEAEICSTSTTLFNSAYSVSSCSLSCIPL